MNFFLDMCASLYTNQSQVALRHAPSMLEYEPITSTYTLQLKSPGARFPFVFLPDDRAEFHLLLDPLLLFRIRPELIV